MYLKSYFVHECFCLFNSMSFYSTLVKFLFLPLYLSALLTSAEISWNIDVQFLALVINRNSMQRTGVWL
jgi:hypothetical protein